MRRRGRDTGSTSCDGNGSTASSAADSDSPSERARERTGCRRPPARRRRRWQPPPPSSFRRRRAWRAVPGACAAAAEIEGAGGRRKAGDARRAGRTKPRVSDHALEQRLEGQGRGHDGLASFRLLADGLPAQSPEPEPRPRESAPNASGASGFLNHSRRRESRRERDADDPAAAGFDDVAADDAVGGPVGALHEDVRLDRGDDGVRIVLVEDDDGIDDGERRQDLGAFLLGVDRARRAL